jgi:predicted homoserine dehydrogenase-like protein
VIILDKALESRAEAGNPVRMAIVGAGYMARGIAAHATLISGIELVAISNRTIGKAARVFEEVGRGQARRVDSPGELDDAVARGVPAVADTPEPLCRAERVDVLVEVTGEVEFGAHFALDAIAHGKHVVLVNAELDSTVGPILKAKADQAGVILTNTDGDEPGVAMNLLRYVKTIGLRPVLAGNMKGFLDRHRNPDTQRAFAESVGQGPKRIASYADGTKLSMEATLVANAAGFRVARRGMNGYRCAHVTDLLELYDDSMTPDEGIVDYVLGAEPGSGAFVVGYSANAFVQEYLKYFKMGNGPLYLFYAPWHIPQAEAPLTAARAVLFRDAAVAAMDGPRCEVITIAKRDLRAGEVLDGIGGFTCYGTIENIDVSRRERLLPMGASEGCVLVADVPIDGPITYGDVRLPTGRLIDRLRLEQDKLFTSGEQPPLTDSVRGQFPD